MAEDLKINITADVKDFNAELVSAQNQLRKFQAELKGSTDPSVITTLQAKIVDLKGKIDSLQTSNANFVKGANQARFALNDLSRVAQDAPYGFIGISNNINPLVDSFARLRQETGSNKAAFTALLSELKGVGGIGLAVGVVTSAITIAQIGLSRWTGASEASKKKTKEHTDALSEFKKQIDSVTASAIKQSVELNAYINIAKNATLSDTQRNEALDRANQLMDGYGKKLTLANIATKEITDQTNKFTQALINQAVFDIYAKKIADLTVKLNELKGQLKPAIEIKLGPEAAARFVIQKGEEDRVKKINSEIAALTIQINKLYSDLNANANTLTDKLGGVGKTNTLTEELVGVGKTKKLKDDLDTIEKDYSNAIQRIKNINEVSLTLGLDLDPTEIQKDLKSQISLIESAISHIVAEHNTNPKKEKLLTDLAFIYENLQLQLDEQIKKEKKPLQVKVKPVIGFDESWYLAISKLPQKMVEAGNALDLTPQFKEMGTNAIDAFVSALETGGTASTIGQNFFKGIGKAIGEGMITIGKQLLIFGLGLQKIKAELITNTTAAIFEAIALIAAGTVVKQTSAFATGTRNAPGGMAMVGERGPEMISLPKGSRVVPAAQTSSMMGAMQSVEVYGMLKGQDIYFSNKKYGQTYGRIA